MTWKFIPYAKIKAYPKFFNISTGNIFYTQVSNNLERIYVVAMAVCE